jgi:hypothetical protein
MTNNPLIAKYEELYGKKEEPKPDYYKGEKTHTDKLKELRDTSTVPANTPNIITKANHIPSFKTFDRDDLKISFYQVADKIEQGKAHVASMNMEIDSMSIMRNKIIFEVYVDDL